MASIVRVAHAATVTWRPTVKTLLGLSVNRRGIVIHGRNSFNYNYRLSRSDVSVVATYRILSFPHENLTMAFYYVNMNSQANGDHEVHRLGCSWLPEQHNRIYLGDFVSCALAVRAARQYFWQVNGCYYCSYICHTQ